MNNQQLEPPPIPEPIKLPFKFLGSSASEHKFLYPKRLDIPDKFNESRLLSEVRQRRTDPFNLTLKQFLSLSLEETGELHDRAANLSKQLLDDAWNRGVKQVVICDGKIVYETSGNEMLAAIVKKEAKRRNKPCYAFSAAPIIEESVSSWTHVETDDYYPTLLVNLSPPNEINVENNYIRTNADFDTGNQVAKAFDAKRIGGFLGKLSPLEREIAMHPAGRYAYFRKRAKVWVKDEAGTIHSAIRDDILLVENWQESALIAYSPDRAGFVSRDLLRILKIRIQLDPLLRVTTIYGASSS